MVEVKVECFFKSGDFLKARLCLCNKNWWLRTKSAPGENHFVDVLTLKKILHWDEESCDKKWVDRDGVDLLFYAVAQNDAKVVQIILESDIGIKKRLNTPIFEYYSSEEFGYPQSASILHIAMIVANVSIVRLLLKSGANHRATDKNGIDCLMYACTFGRVENVRFWLDQFSSWNLSRGIKLNGSTALHVAVYYGRNKMKTLQALLDSGRANLDVLNDGGGSVLSNAVDSVDSNVDVVRYLLLQSLKYGVNHRRKARTMKWKLIYGVARGLSRLGVATSGLFAELASESGSTPLQYAVNRGDLEIVELLMEHGAEPFIKNDLSRDVLSYCEAFPEIKTAIKRVKREDRRYKKATESTRETNTSKFKTKKTFTLQRRLSTATDIKYDMYLMNLSTMLKRFGSSSDRKKNFDLCHQDFLERGKLTRFEDLPMGSFVIFISHQWNGYDHPDPNGHQLQVLCKVCDVISLSLSLSLSASVPRNLNMYLENRYFVILETECTRRRQIRFTFYCTRKTQSRVRLSGRNFSQTRSYGMIGSHNLNRRVETQNKRFKGSVKI